MLENGYCRLDSVVVLFREFAENNDWQQDAANVCHHALQYRKSREPKAVLDQVRRTLETSRPHLHFLDHEYYYRLFCASVSAESHAKEAMFSSSEILCQAKMNFCPDRAVISISLHLIGSYNHLPVVCETLPKSCPNTPYLRPICRHLV